MFPGHDYAAVPQPDGKSCTDDCCKGCCSGDSVLQLVSMTEGLYTLATTAIVITWLCDESLIGKVSLLVLFSLAAAMQIVMWIGELFIRRRGYIPGMALAVAATVLTVHMAASLVIAIIWSVAYNKDSQETMSGVYIYDWRRTTSYLYLIFAGALLTLKMSQYVTRKAMGASKPVHHNKAAMGSAVIA